MNNIFDMFLGRGGRGRGCGGRFIRQHLEFKIKKMGKTMKMQQKTMTIQMKMQMKMQIQMRMMKKENTKLMKKQMMSLENLL